jgi:putative membrane-bound dehydrogenase-like protein
MGKSKRAFVLSSIPPTADAMLHSNFHGKSCRASRLIALASAPGYIQPTPPSQFQREGPAMLRSRVACVLGLVLMVALSRGDFRAVEPAKAPEVKGPLAAKEALKHFKLPPGLRIELVASEPQIESPVAMAFDEDGKLWVVEMRDYPNGPAKGEPPQGRIKVLEDRDGDGFYETSTLFADNLLFANGLLPWKGGVIVTAAPHILYLKDTKGTGKADLREVWYEGFAAQNPQLRVNHPVLGPDGWIYVANGLRGGQIKKAGDPDAKPINLSGMDFRFDPISGKHEAISGMGQYGNAFDDFGRRFVCDNRHHLRHIVLESRYIKRNPFLAVPEVVQDISELAEGPLNSGAKVYPLSKNWTTSNLHAGRFTAACSVHIYRGDLLPKEYRGRALTCEPTGDLVHEEVLTPKGATFVSKPPREGVEFLATPDDWCRPVFLSEGPDGALYVVDMYRAVIEHPEFMPPELKQRPDLVLGKDKGRIWRIVPEKHDRKTAKPQLGKADTETLVKLLEHPNAWQRTTAQRLLWERQAKEAASALDRLAANSPEPAARFLASGLLESLGGMKLEGLHKLLADKHARIREEAVRLAEPRLSSSADLQKTVVGLSADPDARVRFQVALTLGEWDSDEILPPLAKIARAGFADRWTRIAVASAVPRRSGALLALLLEGAEKDPAQMEMVREFAAIVGGRRDKDELPDALEALAKLPASSSATKMAGLGGIAEGVGRRGGQLAEVLKALPAERKTAVERTAELLKDAAGVAGDGKRPTPERVLGVRLLAHAPWEIAEPALVKLIDGAGAQEVRLAAVSALADHPRKEVPGLLMKSWRAYTPALRREVTEAMMRQPARVFFFLDELQAGRVKPGDLDALRIRQLTNHSQPKIKERAIELLKNNMPVARKQVLDKYQAALKLSGDGKKGRDVFQKNCATCHKVAGVGIDVGPDISDTRTKTVDALLLDILNPNAAIDNNYINYVVTTKSGKSLSGIIAVETASSITLKRAENQTDTILRQDIDEIQSTGVSLMPEELEKNIPIEDMAHLLAFLKNWRYLDGAVPTTPGSEKK